MANDWIKLRTKLARDGRVRVSSKICHALPVTVLGSLVTLWCLADEHADENGVLVGYSADDIDQHVGVPGFCASLPADWVDVSGEWVKLPEYQEHNGTTAKSRAQATKRKRHEREVTDVENESRSDRDKNATREEKRREEDKSNKSSLRSDSSTASPPTTQTTVAEKQVKFNLRLSQITRDAMAAYNAILAKPHGHCRVATEVGFEKKCAAVKRSLKVASDICKQQYGDPQITPRFWRDYFLGVSADEFKSGRRGGGKGHEGWYPSFGYLTRPDVIVEVFEQAVTDSQEAA